MGINLKALQDGSMGMEGADLGNGEFIVLSIPYYAGGATAVGGPILSRAVQVQAITGVPDVTTTNAVTATVKKVASGTALSSGTTLHASTYNGQGTANTNQSLTVSTTAGVATVAAGSRIGVVWSGSPGAAGAGVITVICTPV